MKKYFLLSFLFLSVAVPVMAKSSNETQNQLSGQQNSSGTTSQSESTSKPVVTIIPTRKAVVSPTGNQVKNQNEVQTQNQGEDSQLSIKTQEAEQLNQTVDESLTKVSDQVQNLIDTVGAKGGIGQQVKEIAQSQIKLQDEIKSDFEELNSRGNLTKLLVGSNKKLTKSMEQKMEQNRLMIQQLEQLKSQTKNPGDLQQLQETINLMNYQNTSLQNKIDKENKSNGLFGWLVNLFNR